MNRLEPSLTFSLFLLSTTFFLSSSNNFVAWDMSRTKKRALVTCKSACALNTTELLQVMVGLLERRNTQEVGLVDLNCLHSVIRVSILHPSSTSVTLPSPGCIVQRHIPHAMYPSPSTHSTGMAFTLSHLTVVSSMRPSEREREKIRGLPISTILSVV